MTPSKPPEEQALLDALTRAGVRDQDVRQVDLAIVHLAGRIVEWRWTVHLHGRSAPLVVTHPPAPGQ